MTTSAAPDVIREFDARPLGESLRHWAYRLVLAAVVVSMTTPRIDFGGFHINGGDLLAAAASVCWLTSWVLLHSTRLTLRAAVWPLVILAAGTVSATASLDLGAVGVGLIELTGLWLLPALTIPNIFRTDQAEGQLLTSISLGSLIAGVANLTQAVQIGLGQRGLPQVWGAAQYLQGYFQVIGLTVAASRFLTAIASKKASAALLWSVACFVNAGALVLTQTRGAWLACIVAMLVLGIFWRPSALVFGLLALSVGALALGGVDWASTVRERVQSTFTLEAGLSGFESSIGRLALMVTSWRMFLAHPLTGIGLKNFPIAMAFYAPPEMPLAYLMGPDQVLTAVQGPHSTYLSLLSEVGIGGLVGILCWQSGAMLRVYRLRLGSRSSERILRTNAPVLLAALTVIAVYNCFFEMNQAGAFVFVALLAVAYRWRQQPRATPMSV